MTSSADVRSTIIEQLDALALECEDMASRAAGDGAVELASDLWVTSARLIAAADELWTPVRSGAVFLEPEPSPIDTRLPSGAPRPEAHDDTDSDAP
ncbi:MAG: hypothetical protein JJU45_08945 [Acidimicrobiia bacterium]|nr:hypothetical protein [Acidimicrobiia bacterium]